MTTLSQLIDRIDDKASSIEPRRAIVGIITLPLWLVGFAIGIIVRGLWLIGVYLYSSASVGFQSGFRRQG